MVCMSMVCMSVMSACNVMCVCVVVQRVSAGGPEKLTMGWQIAHRFEYLSTVLDDARVCHYWNMHAVMTSRTPHGSRQDSLNGQ